MYLLGQEHIYTGGEPKPHGEFAPYVDSIREIGAVRFMALVEDADTTAIEKEMIECVGINEMQTALVQMMRDELAGR